MCHEDDEFYPTGGPGHPNLSDTIAGAIEFHCAKGPRAPGEHGFNLNVGAILPFDLTPGAFGFPSPAAPLPAPPPSGAPTPSQLDSGSSGASFRARSDASQNRIPHLQSPNGNVFMVFQADGNLVVYQRDGTILWGAGANGRGGVTATVQNDGNFVIYNAQERPVWASGTNGPGRAGAVLKMQDDGNLVLYLGSKALWASGSFARAPVAARVVSAAPQILTLEPAAAAYDKYVERDKNTIYYFGLAQILRAQGAA